MLLHAFSHSKKGRGLCRQAANAQDHVLFHAGGAEIEILLHVLRVRGGAKDLRAHDDVLLTSLEIARITT